MEFVLVAPLVIILVSMILQFAHIWTARQVTAYAAYCAARATMVVPKEEKKTAAKKAAELACAWMSLAGLPGSTGGQEVMIKGWGTIPGSDSAGVRVKADVRSYGGPDDGNVAMVKVEFKFPLLLPLAGRMISYFVKQGEDNPGSGDLDPHDYGSHSLAEGNNPAWSGQEAVMDESGVIHYREGATFAADGRFPAITLTDTCVLPMRYSAQKMRSGVYPSTLDFPKGGGL
jgi:hypothetical protein